MDKKLKDYDQVWIEKFDIHVYKKWRILYGEEISLWKRDFMRIIVFDNVM